MLLRACYIVCCWHNPAILKSWSQFCQRRFGSYWFHCSKVLNTGALTVLPFCTIYTERQKKLITSLECHPLKSKASIWIIFGHRLGKFILNKHIAKKTKVYFNHRGDKCDEIARGRFSKKISVLLASQAGSSKQTISRTAFT